MLKLAARLLALFVGLGLASPLVHAQKKSADAAGHPWWQHAVFYEIYPRSYADSNGDGYGDLNGIASKLDYLHALGVDAIWIAPCFPSPQVDFGYDVSDYENIDPKYGTLADFDRLEKLGEDARRPDHSRFRSEPHLRPAPVVHRLAVIAHSASATGTSGATAKAPNQPPNNWISTFGGSAWQWDGKTNQYYYHFFYPQQPDLNWRNPAVRMRCTVPRSGGTSAELPVSVWMR